MASQQPSKWRSLVSLVMGQEDEDRRSSTGSIPLTPYTPRLSSRPGSSSEPSSPTAHLGDELNNLNSRLAEFLNDIGALEARNAILESQLENDRRMHEDERSELRQRYEKEADEMKAYITQLQDQNRELRNATTKEQIKWKAKLNSAHQAHMEELNRLRDDLEYARANDVERVRQEMANHVEKSQARLQGQLQSTQQKLAQTQQELERVKNEPRQDASLAAELANVRLENSRLLSQLADSEKKHAMQKQDLENRLKVIYDDLQRANDLMIDKDRALKEIEESNSALFREVSLYRSLLDKEIPRITPSKTKKRKLNEQFPALDTSPQSDVSFPSTPKEKSPPLETVTPEPTSASTPGSHPRRSSMKMTIEAARQFLGVGPVKLSEVDSSTECVLLSNVTANDVDLTGWRVHSDKGKKDYKFPPKTMIKADGELRLWSGKQNENKTFDSANLWWTPRSVWDKRGEVALLFDSEGDKISECPAK